MLTLGRIMLILCGLALLPIHSAIAAGSHARHGNSPDNGFESWLSGVRAEARKAGISESTLDDSLSGIDPLPEVIRLDRKQPESTKSFEEYIETALSAKRVNEGIERLRENRDLLDKISRHYGVQPEFIVALWGVETSYGKHTGNFSVVQSLATLAFDGRRSDYFRSELLNALRIIDAGHIAAERMDGSWAGAMGQCQFMPSSFMRFAEDYNNDGKKDIWNSKADIFASIANYLSSSGWNDEKSWGRAVALPDNFNLRLAGKDNEKPLSEWSRLGISQLGGRSLPNAAEKASLILPDEGDESHAYLVTGNYMVLLKWNRSLYFATSVGLLADALARSR